MSRDIHALRSKRKDTQRAERAARAAGVPAPTQRAQQRVLSLLKIAKDIVLRQGFAELSLRELARQAKISLSNLQYYFPSYEMLVESVLLSFLEGYEEDRAAHDADSKASPIEHLEWTIRYFVADVTQPRTATAFFEFWTVCQRNKRFSRLMDKLYGRYTQRWEKLISAANPRMSPEQRTTCALMIVAQLEGLLVLYCHGNLNHPAPEQFKEDVIQRTLRLALEG